MTHTVPVKPHPHNIAALGNSPEFGEIRLNHKTWQPQAGAPAQLLFSRALSFCPHAALPQIPLFPGSRLSERKGNRSLGNSSKRPNYSLAVALQLSVLHLLPCAHRGQKRKSNALELELKAVAIWVLGIEIWSSGKATSILNPEPALKARFSKTSITYFLLTSQWAQT